MNVIRQPSVASSHGDSLTLFATTKRYYNSTIHVGSDPPTTSGSGILDHDLLIIYSSLIMAVIIARGKISTVRMLIHRQ